MITGKELGTDHAGTVARFQMDNARLRKFVEKLKAEVFELSARVRDQAGTDRDRSGTPPASGASRPRRQLSRQGGLRDDNSKRLARLKAPRWRTKEM
jgi:hypothetical protein